MVLEKGVCQGGRGDGRDVRLEGGLSVPNRVDCQSKKTLAPLCSLSSFCLGFGKKSKNKEEERKGKDRESKFCNTNLIRHLKFDV